MLNGLLIGFLIFANFFSIQEEKEVYPFSKWDKSTKEKANSAKDVDYLTFEEKEVIYLCNLARLNPKLFGETYVKQYVDSLEMPKTSYVNSLFATLKKMKKVDILSPQKDLYEVAKTHAEDSGKKGTIGHQNVTTRFKKHAPRYGETAENCDYGSDKAIDIVMSLMIDEGVSDKGHRENILEKAMKSVGVAIREHKKWDYTCVMDFGDL